MNTRTLIILLLGAIVSLCGCYNPLNAYTAQRYYESGMKAAERGDLSLARQNFSRAYINTQIGHLGPEPAAYSLLYWARASGYLGIYEDAERGFNEVLSLIDKAEGKADDLKPPTLAELARLLYDTEQYEKAIPFFEKAVIEFDKRKLAESDPIGYALFLDDFSQCLMAASYAKRADEIAARSAMLKKANKGATAKHIFVRFRITELNVTSAGISSQDLRVVMQRDDWNGIRLVYARLLGEEDLVNSDPRSRAIRHYQYGRALGVTCFFDQAERELNLTYNLDKQAGEPLYLSLVELARLNLNQKKYAQSVIYFDRAILELDHANAAKINPVDYADVLDEYATALAGIGKKEDSEVYAKRALKIRDGNRRGNPIIDRTPYGKYCKKGE
jgi:tetratricopeptide (TPR) repeat protein